MKRSNPFSGNLLVTMFVAVVVLVCICIVVINQQKIGLLNKVLGFKSSDFEQVNQTSVEADGIPLKSWSQSNKQNENGIALSSLEIADNERERAQGLQNRPELCSDCGMLFVFENQSVVSFWMKNTMIPLDMIFFDEDGVVVAVHENTTPYQLSPSYSSTLPAKYVLEVNSGYAKQHSIEVGNTYSMDSLIDLGKPFDESWF